MTERVQMALRVPVADVEAYEKRIDEKYVQKHPYAGTELEREIRSFLNMDGLSKIESLVDDFLEAAGRRPQDFSEKKRPEARAPADGGTKPVNYRIDEAVRDEFMSYVKEHSSSSAGRVLGTIMRSYAQGGIVKRIHDRLSRVAEDTKRLLSGLKDGQEDGSVGRVEANVLTISDRLTETDPTFPDDELVEAIHDVAATGPRAADKTVEKYRRMVVDHLDVEPHPNVEAAPNPTRVWIPSERAKEIAEDGTPRVCRLPVDLLDDDELTRRVCLEAGRRAYNHTNGLARVTLPDVHETILDAEVSRSTAEGALESATLEDGFTADTDGGTRLLKVNLQTTVDYAPDLFTAIKRYADGERPETEDTDGETAKASSPDSADGEWNRLEAATDGGWTT